MDRRRNKDGMYNVHIGIGYTATLQLNSIRYFANVVGIFCSRFSKR